MSVDLLAESVRLIATGVVCERVRLSRRRRFLHVGVDVHDDIAGTVFLRRAHGGVEWINCVLTRGAAGWQLHGGGGGGDQDFDVLTRVPTHADLGGPGCWDSGAGSLVDAATDRWVQLAVVRTVPAVSDVVLADGRVLPNTANGHITVVWEGRAALSAELRDGDGVVLSTLTLGG